VGFGRDKVAGPREGPRRERLKMRSYHADCCHMRLVWHAIANVVAWAFVGWMLWWRASFVLWFDREFNSDAPPFGPSAGIGQPLDWQRSG
jgi:hypothetical protein